MRDEEPMMADEPRYNASGAEAWVPDDGSPESAYEGRERPTEGESQAGTRTGRGAAPPTGQGGSTGGAAPPHPILDELAEENRREGGGAPEERRTK
jgi:hypothetical protein